MLRVEVGPPFAGAVSRPDGENRTLAILRLDHNPCGEEGGRSLVAALAGNALTVSLEGCAFIAHAAGAAGRGRGGAGGAGAMMMMTMKNKMIKSKSDSSSSNRGAADTSTTTSNAAHKTHKGYFKGRDGGDGGGGGDDDDDDDDTAAGVEPTTSDAGGNKGEIEMVVEHLPPPMTAAELQNLVGQLGTDRLSDFEQLRQLEMFLRPHRLTVGRCRAKFGFDT